MTEAARERLEVEIRSNSAAADLGYYALSDLAGAAEGIDYRVIGGQMVAPLMSAYPLPALKPRATLDADVGIDIEIAADEILHRRLIAVGYEPQPTFANRSIKSVPGGSRLIDLLLPSRDHRQSGEEVSGRGFDLVPGLRLAMSAPPLQIRATIHLRAGDVVKFDVLVPDVEFAVTPKACAWQARYASKDVADLALLFEVVDAHRSSLTSWLLDRPDLRGIRGDAVRALQFLRADLVRNTYDRRDLPIAPARLAALIAKHARNLRGSSG